MKLAFLSWGVWQSDTLPFNLCTFGGKKKGGEILNPSTDIRLCMCAFSCIPVEQHITAMRYK